MVVTSSMAKVEVVIGIVRITVLQQNKDLVVDASAFLVHAIVVGMEVGAEAAHSVHMTCVLPKSRSRS